jgi:hypothetical protein
MFVKVTYVMKHIDGYKVKGFKGQIMTFEESRKTKNVINGHIFVHFLAVDISQRSLSLFF